MSILLSVRSLQHSEFNNRLRTKTSAYAVINSYSCRVSEFALSHIQDEYSRSLKLTQSVEPQGDQSFVVDKQRATYSSCSAYCRHGLNSDKASHHAKRVSVC